VVTTRALAPELAGDFLAFFDDTAFTDNVGWASCYCMFHHLDGSTWGERRWQDNRADMVGRIRAGSTTGILAYADDVVAGWVNASRLGEYPPHRHGDSRDNTTGAIVCFLVAPAYRGHGLGSLLLDAACDVLRDAGLSGVEAYPAERSAAAASAYHGTPEMYRRAGFIPAADGVVFRSL
jgi:GNAT superfamily N-acetyltransferase